MAADISTTCRLDDKRKTSTQSFPFFPQTSGDSIFPEKQWWKALFPALNAMKDFFYSVVIFFARYFLAIIFSFEIRLQDIFFLKSPIPPLKSQMVGPLDATSATSFGGSQWMESMYLWQSMKPLILLESAYTVKQFFAGWRFNCNIKIALNNDERLSLELWSFRPNVDSPDDKQHSTTRLIRDVF